MLVLPIMLHLDYYAGNFTLSQFTDVSSPTCLTTSTLSGRDTVPSLLSAHG